MAAKQILENVLKKPMTRREFLTQVGALFLAVIGVTSILHALANASHHGTTTSRNEADGGYGSMPYGGL